jgi:UDP-4-amino-4-deoxy-L-arabinose-oxoglutarate aminotransferase
MIELNGGTTVFCVRSIRPTLPTCMDVAHVAKLITPKTRAIMPVHFAGAPCDLTRAGGIGARAGVALIEDAATPGQVPGRADRPRT